MNNYTITLTERELLLITSSVKNNWNRYSGIVRTSEANGDKHGTYAINKAVEQELRELFRKLVETH